MVSSDLILGRSKISRVQKLVVSKDIERRTELLEGERGI
jgi:hypothetical protein